MSVLGAWLRTLLTALCCLGALGVSSVAAQTLDESERAYLVANAPLTLCVDPDWSPFEVIDASGQHVGIAADLLALVGQRLGAGF